MLMIYNIKYKTRAVDVFVMFAENSNTIRNTLVFVVLRPDARTAR